MSTRPTTDDGLSFRRKQFSAGRSISMATVQAQVTLAQSLRNLFQAARDPRTESTDSASVEDIWLQAVYNAVVFSMVGVFLCILIAVYCILEPFLHPLLWAVLIGAFLFPFKHTGSTYIESWLQDLDNRDIPMVAGLFVSPVHCLHNAVIKVEQIIIVHWKRIAFLAFLTIIFYLRPTFDILFIPYCLLSFVFKLLSHLDLLLTYTKSLQVRMMLFVLYYK